MEATSHSGPASAHSAGPPCGGRRPGQTRLLMSLLAFYDFIWFLLLFLSLSFLSSKRASFRTLPWLVTAALLSPP